MGGKRDRRLYLRRAQSAARRPHRDRVCSRASEVVGRTHCVATVTIPYAAVVLSVFTDSPSRKIVTVREPSVDFF